MGTTRRTFLATAASLILSTKALCSNLVESEPFETLGSLPEETLKNLNFFIYGSKEIFGEPRVYPYRLFIDHIEETQHRLHPKGYAFELNTAVFKPLPITFEEEYIHGLSVWTKQGREFKRAAFSSRIRMIEGDTLHIRYTMTVEASTRRDGMHGFCYNDGRRIEHHRYLRD